MIKEGFVCNYLTVEHKVSDKKSTKYLCKCKCGKEKVVADNLIRYGKIQDCGCHSFALDEAKKDFVGKKFGELVIVDCYIAKTQKSNRIFAKCLCSCGKHINKTLTEIKNGHIKSCGCLRTFDFDRDYKNKVFNNITILELLNPNEKDYLKKKIRCLCHCGKTFETYLIYLTKHTRYITGCPFCNNKINPLFSIKKREELTDGKIKNVFYSMKSRCYNTNNKSYKWYGAKNITICNEWLNNTQAFVNWAKENGYKEGLTIDRIDTSIGYSPSNCRWVDMETQNNNKPSIKKYLVGSQWLSLSQSAHKLGICISTLKSRIYRGMDFYSAIKYKKNNGKV